MIPPKPATAPYNDEQWQAIHQKGSNVLVAASAGSGKTTVLIERILTHVLDGYASLDELLVCTFTEAAANEMKERMESRLKSALTQTVSSDTQQVLIQQLRLLPTAHIRTLHSFCLQVIQQFFYLVDMDPEFSLMTDDTQQQLMYQTVWDDVVQAIEDGESTVTMKEYATLLGQYSDSKSDRGLYELVLNVYRFATSHPEPTIWLQQLAALYDNVDVFSQSELYRQVVLPYLSQIAHTMYQLLQHAHATLQGASHESVAKYDIILSQEMANAQALYEAIIASDLANVMALVRQLSYDKWPITRKTHDDYDTIQAVKSYRDIAKKMSEKFTDLFDYDVSTWQAIESRIAPTVEHIAQLVSLFQQHVIAYKRKLKVMDYNDLEHVTLDILAPYNPTTKRREASVASHYFQQQFKEVLVDEYQDINDIQATILAWLSHEHCENQSGNLFMVGDVKQSIYGFRMAEPSLFMEKYTRYATGDGGELIVLDRNYRSRDEVLQFTNFVFERLMDTEFGEMAYTHKESLKTGNTSFLPASPSDDFNVEMIVHVKESSEDDALEESEFDTSIEVESHLVAQDIQAKVAAGFQVYDKKLNAMRPVTYRDFVILTATRSPFLAIQRTFEAYGIPLLSQKVENYFQRQEIRLIVALLKLIDNPIQDIPLVAILRSYFVGIDEEGLSRIRIAYPNGNFDQACRHYMATKEDDLSQQLTQFYTQLTAWRHLSQRVGLVPLLWDIYTTTNFLDYVAGLSNGVQRQANLHAFYHYAQQFEQTSYTGVYGFVTYIEQMLQYDNDLAEPVVLEQADDVVRMMTVHASKGLEFPIVCLVNTSKTFNLMDTHQPYVASKHYGLGTDLYDTEHYVKYASFIKKALRLEKVQQLKSEELRKLYVALTRCEQKLIIVGTINSQDAFDKKQESVVMNQSQGTLQVPTYERQSARSWFNWFVQALAIPEQPEQSCTAFRLSQVTWQWRSSSDVQLARQNNTQKPQQDKAVWLEALNTRIQSTRIELPMFEQWEQRLTKAYDYGLASRTSSYQSVSELKRLYEEPNHAKLGHFSDRRQSNPITPSTDKTTIQSIRYTQDTFEMPTFLRTKQVDYAQIGTATHYLLQQLPFEQFVHIPHEQCLSQLADVVQQLVDTHALDAHVAMHIQLDTVAHFIQSEMGQQLCQSAHTLQRERAFSYLLPAKWLFKAQLDAMSVQQLHDDQLLIHGILDMYFQVGNNVVLLDYKTDRYKPYGNATRQEQIDAIVQKYRFQMSLYAQALSCATNQTVESVYLVLLDFNEVVRVDTLYTFGD